MDIIKKQNLLISYSLDIRQNDAEMSLSDHLEELRQRAFWSIATLLSSIIVCVFSVKNIVKTLQEPAPDKICPIFLSPALHKTQRPNLHRH